MYEFFTRLFSSDGFVPRWSCGDWSEFHGWLFILSDLGVWSAYTAIPAVLVYFVWRKRAVPFKGLFLLFGAFILACGLTHLLDAAMFWWPAYRFLGLVELLTAVISWATVLALVPIVPRALALRSPDELEREILARRKAEAELQQVNLDLERRIETRTAELVAANATLNQERERFQTTLVSIGDAVIATDTHGRVTLVNRVAETLTGWQQSEASGQPLDVVFRIVNEESRQPVENPAIRALQDGTIVGLANHTVLIARDGKEYPIEDSAAPIRDERGQMVGVVLVFRDVTERRREEVIRQGQEQQFRTLAESIPQLAWMAHADGNIFWYNRRWYDYTGTTLEDMAGWGWQSVHDPAELPKVLERWKESLSTGEPFDMMFPLKGADGIFRQFLTRVEPVKDQQGRVIRWFGTNTDISAAKRVEEELRVAQSRLDSTLTAAEIGTWELDIASNSVRADYNTARMFSVPDDGQEMHGMDIFMQAVHPEDRARLEQVIDQTVRGGDRFEVEYRLVDAAGVIRHVVARGRLQRDPSGHPLRLPGVVVDITAQRLAEQRERVVLAEAATANAKFRAFFDQGALFAGIMDVEGVVHEPNRLSWEGCGYTRDQIVGKLFWEGPWWAPSPRIAAQIKAGSELAARGQVFRAETSYFVADGSERLVDVTILPIKDEQGQVMFLAPTGIDITERRRLEDDLRRLAADLSEANHRKDEFLATLAHELRNPLAPIRNGLELMRLASDEPAAVEQARTLMERQLVQLVRLVDDLMDVSRITRGKIELRREHVDLASIVQSAVETSRPLIDEMRHELTVILPDEPILVDADPTRLSQVFMNLFNNAAKYSERGGHIWLHARTDGGEVVVTVKDEGVGIAADQLPLIFEMFTQVDRSLEKSQGGLGIGLTLVKRLVEMHGGRIEAFSGGPGTGSEFVVRLPAVVESPMMQNVSTEASPATQTLLRIAIVDDNQDGANTLAAMLRRLGHDVRTAYDGLQGVMLADTFRPDVMLLDIGLPKLNGYEACRRIREQPWGQDIVLIAVTGWGQEEDRRRSQAAGFDHHLVKPLEPAGLLKLLATLKKPG